MTTPIHYNKQEKTFTITQNTGVTVSIALLIMFAGAVISATTWVTTTQSRIDGITKSVQESREQISDISKRTTSGELKFVEIQTQLRGIDAALLEIKQAVKK